ncbi:hypothetical protein CCUS01_00584 [Colletotrichum cuscutae]|uniref:Uncharacterized protein n=1 Tax=Colletotrichum cuscutae TaxID=1209917 RepID=A0AAI9VB62_9PEZI|nr:hypothetical protein CCUS01_00584 [Colletotrichum cuscutae]
MNNRHAESDAFLAKSFSTERERFAILVGNSKALFIRLSELVTNNSNKFTKIITTSDMDYPAFDIIYLPYTLRNQIPTWRRSTPFERIVPEPRLPQVWHYSPRYLFYGIYMNIAKGLCQYLQKDMLTEATAWDLGANSSASLTPSFPVNGKLRGSRGGERIESFRCLLPCCKQATAKPKPASVFGRRDGTLRLHLQIRGRCMRLRGYMAPRLSWMEGRGWQGKLAQRMRHNRGPSHRAVASEALKVEGREEATAAAAAAVTRAEKGRGGYNTAFLWMLWGLDHPDVTGRIWGFSGEYSCYSENEGESCKIIMRGREIEEETMVLRRLRSLLGLALGEEAFEGCFDMMIVTSILLSEGQPATSLTAGGRITFGARLAHDGMLVPEVVVRPTVGRGIIWIWLRLIGRIALIDTIVVNCPRLDSLTYSRDPIEDCLNVMPLIRDVRMALVSLVRTGGFIANGRSLILSYRRENRDHIRESRAVVSRKRKLPGESLLATRLEYFDLPADLRSVLETQLENFPYSGTLLFSS